MYSLNRINLLLSSIIASNFAKFLIMIAEKRSSVSFFLLPKKHVTRE